VKDKGGTGAAIGGSTLSTTGTGTVVVTATIANGTAVGTAYTQDFDIVIIEPFVPVTGIMGIPARWPVGVDLALNGTVAPPNASNQAISWSVTTAGMTGATISGSTLSTTGTGTVVVTATIANGKAVGTAYTQDFDIDIIKPFVPIPGITGIPASRGKEP
jgi:endo-1,4-beta-xylanase